MGTLIARRVAILIPTMLIVSFLVFSLIVLIPGDPAVEIAGGPDATAESIRIATERFNLDDPFFVRYWDWLTGAVQGDFGLSWDSGRQVTDLIVNRIPISASIAGAGIVIGTFMGVLLGTVAGMFPGSRLDRGLMSGTVLGIAIPNFWLAMVLVWLVAIELELWQLPALGYTHFGESGQDRLLWVIPLGWLKSILLPGIALGTNVSASIGRQLRAALADTMSSNYVRTAWAKGGHVRTVVAKHAMKNALIPAVTVLGLQVSALLGGTVLIEQIFSIEGLGRLVLQSVSPAPGDLPVVQAAAVLFVTINIVVTLIIDIVYGWLDPRVRVS